jgi:hypothetical protein
MRPKSWVGPMALAILVVLLVGGAVWIGRGSGSSSEPASSGRAATLHLSGSGSGATVAMAARAAGAAGAADAKAPPAGSPGYVLTGTLPDGQPGDRTVWHPRTPHAADATSIAKALGLDATPTRVDGGWVLRHGANRLVVRDQGTWSYGMDCAPDQPVSSQDVSVMCAYATGSGVAAPDAGTASSAPNSGAGSGSSSGCDPSSKDCGTTVEPAPPPVPAPVVSPGPSDAQARSAAAPILDRLGLGNADVVVYAGDPTASVQAAPKVDGMVTSGWATSLQIDGNGDLTSGDGWLAGADKGDSYPLITAHRGFELLQQQPRPMIEMCMRRSDGKPGCATVPPAEVTGASLGLMLDYDGQRATLVPAWLFDVKGQHDPVAQVAVEPSYLAPPPTAKDDTGVPNSVPPVEASPVEVTPR